MRLGCLPLVRSLDCLFVERLPQQLRVRTVALSACSLCDDAVSRRSDCLMSSKERVRWKYWMLLQNKGDCVISYCVCVCRYFFQYQKILGTSTGIWNNETREEIQLRFYKTVALPKLCSVEASIRRTEQNQRRWDTSQQFSTALD
jgi:hypothetical protein